MQVQLPAALLKDVRDHVARDDREITDGYERQAVITGAGYALGLAGLWDESEALLKANLAKSHSPYYLMSQLGSNAKKLGRKDEALKLVRQAFEHERRPGDAAAVGLGLPDGAGRPGAAGRRAHREDRGAAVRRGGEGPRRVRRPQRALAAARGHQAAGLERRRQAGRGAEAAAGAARRRVRQGRGGRRASARPARRF